MRNVTDECIQIVIGDGHPMFVDGIRALLHSIETLSIVAEVSTGSAAYRSIMEFSPRIAILDSAMAGMRGLAILDQLRADAEGTAIIILSDCEETTYVHRVLAAGVRGYLLKRSTGSSIIEAVHAVSRGGLYLDPAIAAQIIPTGVFGASGTTGGKPAVRALTEREREVLRLIALGFTNKEVAGRLGITTKSIETYKTRATEKLDIHSRAKIVQYAMVQGWLESPLP